MNANAVTLKGILIAIDSLRHTPAGMPLVSCRLAHESQQSEAGTMRKVACEIDAVAIGETATAVSTSKSGDTVTLGGFLARKDRTNPKLILHITHFEKDY